SIFNATPGYAESLLRGKLKFSLRVLLIGADVLSPNLANKLRDVGVAQRIFNLCGATECCIDATVYEISNLQFRGSVPIGSPLPNYRLYVLDGGLEPVPVGVAGELY